MKNHLSISYGLQLDSFSKGISTEWNWPSPGAGFAAYLAVLSGITLPSGCEITPLSSNHLARLEEAPLLASVGYAFALGLLKDAVTLQAWKAGMERLQYRRTFTNDRESFVYRPLELLGITLGVAHCPEISATISEWLCKTLQRAASDLSADSLFSNIIGAWSASIGGDRWDRVHLPTLNDLNPVELALSFWTVNLHPELLTGEHPTIELLSSEIGKRFALTQISETDVARGFLLYSSLRSSLEGMIGVAGGTAIYTAQTEKREISLPMDLKKALQSHSVTVIAGAGISRAAAGLKGWDSALKSAVTFLNERGVTLKSLNTVETLVDEGLYEAAAQVIEQLLNDINGKSDFLRRQFNIDASAIRDRALIEAIWRIAGQVVFTTNYDRLFQMCGPSGVETVTWQDPNKLLAALRGESSVVHLHGVYNVPDSVVFSASDYTRLSMDDTYRSFGQALWTRGPLLFIGSSPSGISDMDFSRLFAWGRQVAPQSPYTSYTLQLEGSMEPDMKRVLYSKYKVEVIEYGSDYADLRPFLEAFPTQ